MRTPSSGLLLLGLVLALLGCGDSATEKANEDVRQLAQRLYSEVGTPEINNFQEYKFAKQIMEMRDERITTYTYQCRLRVENHAAAGDLRGLTKSSPKNRPWRHGRLRRKGS